MNLSHQAPALDLDLPNVPIADVVGMIDAPDLAPTYSYRIPDTLVDRLRIGDCVLVPFGGQEVLGYVMATRDIAASDPLTSRLKEIESLVEGAVTFNHDQAALARFMADRYVCSLADAVRCVAPATMGSPFVPKVRLSEAARSAERFDGAG